MDSAMESVRKADIYHDMGLWEKSEEIFLSMIEDNPQDFYAYYRLGCLQEEVLDYQRAAEYYMTALRLEPGDFNTLYKLGGICMVNGDLEVAAEYYRRCLDINEGSARVNYNLGLISYRNGKWFDAADYFAAATELGDEFPDIWYMLGMSFMAIGRLKMAVDAFGRAAGISPDRSDIYFNQGNALLRLQRTEEAENAFGMALKLSPNNSRYLLGLGQVYFFSGKNGLARTTLQQVLDVDPKNEAARLLSNALDGRQIDQVPGTLLAKMFDQCSGKFEAYMVNELKYQLPVKIREAVEQCCAESGVDFSFARGMDLGCGTGLAGEQFASATTSLTGVDISPGMIEVAGRKNIYRELICDDLHLVLEKRRDKFELFLAADVFIYLGSLDKIFAAVSGHCSSGGWFAFSTELTGEGDYILCRSGVFAHSTAYIERLAEAHGFEVAFRRNSGCDNFSNVLIYVLRKK